MPNKTVNNLIGKVELLESAVAMVVNDVKWIKWLVMGITGGWGAILVAVAIWLIQK